MEQLKEEGPRTGCKRILPSISFALIHFLYASFANFSVYNSRVHAGTSPFSNVSVNECGGGGGTKHGGASNQGVNTTHSSHLQNVTLNELRVSPLFSYVHPIGSLQPRLVLSSRSAFILYFYGSRFFSYYIMGEGGGGGEWTLKTHVQVFVRVNFSLRAGDVQGTFGIEWISSLASGTN